MLHTSVLEADDPAVRLAIPRDEEAIVAMVRQMHAEGEGALLDGDGRPFAFSADKTRATVQRATQANRNHPDAGRAWIGVVDTGGELRGSAYVEVMSPWCEDGQFLCEKWNWVFPEHRRGDASDALIAFSIKVADTLKLSLLAAAMTRERMAKSRFYERKIGMPIGSLFLYNNTVGV